MKQTEAEVSPFASLYFSLMDFDLYLDLDFNLDFGLDLDLVLDMDLDLDLVFEILVVYLTSTKEQSVWFPPSKYVHD